MDKKTLKQYITLKKEVSLLETKLNELYDKKANIPTVMGTVVGSSKEHPYIESRTMVEMDEPKINTRIKALIWLKEQRKEQSESLVVEIEEYISNIKDAETRVIFELAYQDGMSQGNIAKELNIDRSYVSKKIKGYLQLSHNSH